MKERLCEFANPSIENPAIKNTRLQSDTNRKCVVLRVILFWRLSVNPFEFDVADGNDIPFFHTFLFELCDYAAVFKDFLEERKGILRRNRNVLDEEVHKSANRSAA